MAGTPRVSKTTSSQHHHGSHRHLLQQVTGFPADVDAIIVPTARNVATLKPAVELAEKLGSTLVVLCSKYSRAREIAPLVRGKVKFIAIDVNGLPDGVIPTFETDRVLAGTRFARWTDTSLKRNLGLLLAGLIGWERIVFLDDDIRVPEPMDLREAAGLADHYAGVGLGITGMPDNSVVCHAFRDAGGAQDMFIGGGAFVIGAQSMTSFFPNIYNEDWFFLLDDDGLRPTATTGTAVQNPYDPYREHRAKLEELGDCLAEGLFWLLDNGRSLRDATEEHWRNFLDRRAEFITDVIRMVERMAGDAAQRHRMLLAVKAARGRCQYIKPELCVRYIDAWRRDRVTWRRHLAEVHRTLTAKKTERERRSVVGVRGMFRSLGLPDRIAHLHVPREGLHHDAADFDPAFPRAVGE
jgi:hypothetical protein